MMMKNSLVLLIATLATNCISHYGNAFPLTNPTPKQIGRSTKTATTTPLQGMNKKHCDTQDYRAINTPSHPPLPPPSPNNHNNRRDILKTSCMTFFHTAIFATTFVTSSSHPANAFPNKVSSKFDDRPKRKGPQPKDLNLATRKDMNGEPYIGLKQCGPAPNCFTSTDSIEEDPEHVIPSWKWPDTIKTKEEAFEQLQQVLTKYVPGQGNIDGGGFQIMPQTNLEKGYIYVQFESLKNGYIDDFELAFLDSLDKEVQVRSSSRVGYLDFGVNAKRINYVAKQLRELGWDAVGVDPKTHQDYVIQNSGS